MLIYFYFNLFDSIQQKLSKFDLIIVKSKTMKKIIILSLFLAVTASINAKDISIRIVNENDVPLTIMFGTISSKDNSYSDDEIVQLRSVLKIASLGKPLAPKKKTSFSKTDLPGGNIIIVYGSYQGGGRTNIFRYKVKDIEAELELTFEKIKTIKANNSYNIIAEGLKKSEDLGSFIQSSKNQIVGSFIFYNISADKLGEVYLADPPSHVEVEMTKKVNNLVYDIIFKTATAALMNNKGEIVRAVPPNATEAYNEVTIPGTEKSSEIFGDKDLKFLTWKCTGSMRTNVKYKDNSYMPLYGSCNVDERKYIVDKFMKDITDNGSSDYHLYFITSVHQTDNLEIIDNGMKKIEEFEQVVENDILTSTGNFRLNASDKSVFMASDIINDVKAIDITPLLYYRFILDVPHSNTLSSASNCVEIYKQLGSFVELPALEESIISITSPANTIAKIKEIMSNPKVLENIEAKLHSITPFSISLTAVKAAMAKMNKK
jgi:hypothetical protein